MKRLLKSIWTENAKHWDNQMKSGEEEEFLGCKYQQKTTVLHVFADTSEDTMCAVAYLILQPKENSAELAFFKGKCRVKSMRHLSVPRVEFQAAVMAVRLKEQTVKEHKMKINNCSF